MIPRHVFLWTVIAAVVPQICSAQDDGLNACVEIYKNSTRDYSQAQQTNIELARSFNSFCKKDGTVNTSAAGVGLDAIVNSIPFKFSFSDSTNEQKMEEFCKVGASQYDSWNLNSSASSTVVTDALSNFNSCVDLAKAGLQLKVRLNQPDTLVVSGVASPAYTGFINSVAYDNTTMTCSSADFNDAHKPVTLRGPVHLSTKVPFSITCVKTKQRVGGATFYQRTTLTIAASALSPLAIVFPSDTLNGYELASQASLAVSQAASEVAVAQAATAAQKQATDKLQNRLDGVTVSVYARDLEAHNCFGTGANWGKGLDQEVANTCGSRPHATATDSLRGGGKCGYAAVAYACVNIP
ncbi:hypothetical protein [Burkholderia sp. LMG 21824]|uniref:hypothetical protein n=1 Tax=Burkholderia sp. LMG 21824 TaxID=3158172 RepID=UPI003C2C58F6